MQVKIFHYLNEELIYYLRATNKEEALKELVYATIETKHLPEGERFYQAICDREKIVSTGIGMGVAIPHAKLSSYNDFFIAIGITKKGLDWNSLDNAPV